MSEENKNLKEKAKDTLDDAKEATKNASEKVSEKASELKEDAKEAFDDAKETVKDAADKAGDKASDLKEDAKEFYEDAKQEAKEFADEAKEVLQDDKTIAIIAHLWFIGWIIAIIMNNNKKTEFGSFYIRQTLGIFLISILSFIPILGFIIALVCFALWIMSFVGALGGKTKPVFGLGDQFQEWFKSI